MIGQHPRRGLSGYRGDTKDAEVLAQNRGVVLHLRLHEPVEVGAEAWLEMNHRKRQRPEPAAELFVGGTGSCSKGAPLAELLGQQADDEVGLTEGRGAEDDGARAEEFCHSQRWKKARPTTK